MRLLNTCIIRLTLVFIFGIAAGFHYEISLEVLLTATAISLFIFIISLVRANRLLLQDLFFGASSLLLFFCIGMSTAQVHSPHHQKSHYTNLLPAEDALFLLAIKEPLKENQYYERWITEVRQINGKKSHGKLLLVLPKGEFIFKADHLISVYARPIPIPENLNPQRFSYRKFLANRGILYQMTAADHQILQAPLEHSSLRGAAENLRAQIISKLKENPIGKEELAITQALLLGQRNEIATTTEEQYAAAGVIHILAVSGLHVGILLLLLDNLLSPLERWKYGKAIKAVLLIALLWGYGLLAGLSPSIIRAVTMFSFLAIGMQLKRRTSSLNSVFLSLLFLLMLQPQLLFEVGFQLSYAAVIGILLLQPLFYSLLSPPGLILDYLWKIMSVSLAAQMGVLPLSLYYFHQFPGLFFLSNLIIIPFLGILLSLGIILLLLALVDLLPTFLSLLYNFLIEFLNTVVAWFARQEDFLFTEIPYSLPEIAAFYIFVWALIIFLHRKKSQNLRLLLLAVLTLQITTMVQMRQRSPSEVIIFHKTGNTLIGKQQNKILNVAHNLETPPENLSPVRAFKIENRLRKVHYSELNNLYPIGEDILLVADSSGIYDLGGFTPDRILLTNSIEINLDRLLINLKPKEVIADGSNYYSSVQRWQKTCLRHNIPFHYTGTDGAWRKTF